MTIGERIAKDAPGWYGVVYLWGGESRKGVDCSGWVRCLVTPYGIWPFDDPKTPKAQDRDGTAAMLKVACDPIPWEDRKPGDLVFFGTGKLEHVSHVVVVIDSLTIAGANGGRPILAGETLPVYQDAMRARNACVRTAPAETYRTLQRMGVGRLPGSDREFEPTGPTDPAVG